MCFVFYYLAIDVCFISAETSRELRQLHSSTAGSIMGVSMELHGAMTNDENECSLLLSEHKVNQIF